MFGDNEGLALWTHNVGFGRALNALQIYFADTRHFNIGDYGYAIKKNDPILRERIEKDAARLIKESGVTVHKILTNPAAVEYLSGDLYSGFENYPYKVVAIAQLLQEKPKTLVVKANG